MAAKEARFCEASSRGLPPATETLIRKLVAQAGKRRSVMPPSSPEAVPEPEVLFAGEVDGVRCLLVKSPNGATPLPGLSPREREIARMVAKGFPNKAIAAVLDIS